MLLRCTAESARGSDSTPAALGPQHPPACLRHASGHRLLTEVRRLRAASALPQPPPLGACTQALPGGYKVGEKVFFTGASQTASSGNKVVHGQQGEVMGSDDGGELVIVRFPGNMYGNLYGDISCYLTSVCRLRTASAATPACAPHTRDAAHAPCVPAKASAAPALTA